MFIGSNVQVFGLRLFEAVTIGFTLFLGLIAFVSAFRGKRLTFSLIELLLISFVIWCFAIGLIYLEDTDFKILCKLILPPMTYIIMKRAITTDEQYLKCLSWLIIGFVIPLLWTATLTARGIGGEASYWTGLEHFSGVYSGTHTMGHSMGMLIMIVCIYVTLKITNQDQKARKISKTKIGLLLLLVSAAFYCLIFSYVRTVYIGVAVFAFVALFKYSKKGAFFYAVTFILSILVFTQFFSTIFYDVTDTKSQIDTSRAGSGRLWIWNYNLSLYSRLPFDRQIAGVGIGNLRGNLTAHAVGGLSPSQNNIAWDSHNDFLYVFMGTGAVGLFLILLIYSAIFSTILGMQGREKYIFLAFFFAVLVMNFLSNSYISRFGFAQIFFMVFSYIEISRIRAV